MPLTQLYLFYIADTGILVNDRPVPDMLALAGSLLSVKKMVFVPWCIYGKKEQYNYQPELGSHVLTS